MNFYVSTLCPFTFETHSWKGMHLLKRQNVRLPIIVADVMERHQLDKNDLAIKSEIISMVSQNLREYERAYEEGEEDEEIDDKTDETTKDFPSVVAIISNIKNFLESYF